MIPEIGFKPAWKEARPELLLFVVTAVLAYLLRWEAGDLLWSLWAGSLAFCVLGVFVSIASLPFQAPSRHSVYEVPAFKHPALKWAYYVATPPLILFCATFSAMVFFGFHYLYAYFIYMLYPLIPEIPSVFDVTEKQFEQALRGVGNSYWPFVLIVLINERDYFLSALRRVSPLNLGIPFLRLAKMHVFIFVSVAAVMIGGTGYFFYLVILLFFFFPWGRFLRVKSRLVEVGAGR